MPNQCSSANKAVYILVRYWHTCIALRVLRFASQFVTLLAAPTACVRAATCVLHASSFISSFVPLHYTTFAAFDIAKRHGTLSSTQGKAQVMHIPFRKPSLQCSLGSISLHYVLHSFQSHSVHPLPIIWRALRPATAAGLSWFLSGAHSLDENKNTRQTLAFLVAVYRRFTAL